MSDVTAADVARDLNLAPKGVAAVLELLAEGNTVPFIARYRKERTGGLDEVQIRDVRDRHAYLGELAARKAHVLQTIEGQGKLTDALRRQILACQAKTELEDLYLPFKPKRRTRATMARERGLEPLAALLMDPKTRQSPEDAARAFIAPDQKIDDVDAALRGARDIFAEALAERPEVRKRVRDALERHGQVASTKARNAPEGPTKFDDYLTFSEPVTKIPSHRYLALCRGEAEGVLRVTLEGDDDRLVGELLRDHGHAEHPGWRAQRRLAIEDAYKRLVQPSVSTDIRVALKMRSDEAAVQVFAENLRNLLLASPLGRRATLAIDPGFRTGCKCAVLDDTGRFVTHTTIYPHIGGAKAAEAGARLRALVEQHRPDAIAIGNGTAGRETETFVKQVLKEAGLKAMVVSVNEAGASIYSASDAARDEFPELDLTVRGAISIGRRLQDPLAELVKIDPKAIGVGQYQHDVYPALLKQKLDDVVEDAVNHVGVTLNTASAWLLQYVSGIGPTLARRIVAHRDAEGPFRSRRALRDVAGIGARTFEQAAGFLRIPDGDHPLDASAVHPERYDVVASMAQTLGVSLQALVGNTALVDKIAVERFVGAVGELTLQDVLSELRKPGRDPREAFQAPAFRDDVNDIKDLVEGMTLEGVVTNVTAFGAFVDIGVHQDGLVHISELADRFIKDPNEVVRVGQRLTVRVLSVELKRKRIGLSARSGDAPRGGQGRGPGQADRPRTKQPGSGGDPRRGRKGTSAPRGGQANNESLSHNPFGKLKR